jgi:glycosyltransferase involved in cell wall biosynthesis
MIVSPFFSVIIPTYNRAHYIRETVQSVLNQTFSLFEIIVVDDGSTDNTKEVIETIKDSRVSYYKKTNGERAAARNYGTQHASGQYITFLDSDDLFLEHHLREAYNTINKNKSPEIVHLNFMILNKSDGKIQYFNKKNFNVRNELIVGNPFACMGVFLKKEIALSYPFNEDRDLSATEDYELWIRLASRFNFIINNNSTSYIVNHDERSVTNTDETKLLNRKNKFLKYAFEDEFVKKIFLKSLAKMESSLDTYISIHLALSGQKKRSLFYLRNAFMKDPLVIFSRRFHAIIKRLII